MKIIKGLMIFALFSFIVVASLYRWIKISAFDGGGQFLESPNGRYVASAMTYDNEGFWGNKRPYYKFFIAYNSKGGLQPESALKTVRMDCLPGYPVFSMRGRPRIITWNPESTAATFAFEGREIVIKIE